MSADKVQEAKLRFFGALYSDLMTGEHTADAQFDALIAAVREDEKQKCIAAVLSFGDGFVWRNDVVGEVRDA